MPSLRHYDPRMGDESGSESQELHDLTSRNHRKHVRLDLGFADSSRSSPENNSVAKADNSKPSLQKRIRVTASRLNPLDLKWITDSWTWSKIKPVIRDAVAGWVSLLFVVTSKTERMLGQASFLLLVAAFLDPPSEPFIAVIERELLFLCCICLAWAWCCLGIFLASLARTTFDRSASFATIITGQFIEAAPTVIMAVFMFLGSSFFLYIKARQGPGPFTFITVFSCIFIDIALTTAVLFPYPYYLIGRAIVVPLVIHAGLSIVLSAILFPSTITAQYMNAFGLVLEPTKSLLVQHRAVLRWIPSSQDFADTAAGINALSNRAEGSLAGAGAAYRLLKRDIVWGRFSPGDLADFEYWLRRLVTRSNGMGVYFTLIDPTREKFPVTPAPSAPGTPISSNTPNPSRPSTPTAEQTTFELPATSRRRLIEHVPSPLRNSISRHISRHFHSSSGAPHQHSSHHDNHLHLSLLHLAHNLSLSKVSTDLSANEAAVGVFESQRYLALEANRLSLPHSPENTAHFTKLLSESCDELLEGSLSALTIAQSWIGEVRRGSFGNQRTIEQERNTRLERLEKERDALTLIIQRFREDKRHRVLDPYRCAFDPKRVGASDAREPPPHKYLFHCYVYEYHALQFAVLLDEMLENIVKLEKDRGKARLWLPTLPITKFWIWSRWGTSEELEQNDDENPDIVQGFEPEEFPDLGETGRRDPDALPPQNAFQLVMNWVHHGISELASGNTLFALKAGLLTILLSIPSFLKSSAEFAYGQRFVWAVFMGQLTLARWRGDTTFGLVSRILATFLGCVVGLAMWYISTGSGRGNPYGLAAVSAVCFPFFFFARLYWTGPPMTNIIFFVTIMLVIGYSWQNTHFPIGFNYWGWDLAWRRFLLVVAGVTAAFLFSFLPPSTTLRRYQRRMMSTTVAELGGVYCSIVSFANTHKQEDVDKRAIIQSLIAIRFKLKRSLVLKTNVVYEFSLRGHWPAKRYQKILEIQLQIAFLLSHLMSVVEHLEPAWTRAFLRRTRFLDADFQGDVLAVISLISTSLRTGHPLPQITPCPLLDRFMTYTHGLNVIRHEADDDYGLPRTMTIDTLENEQYLCFTVGVTTAFGIVMRLDRLMVATKELVGEQYHIHGVGLPSARLYEEPDRPAKDV